MNRGQGLPALLTAGILAATSDASAEIAPLSGAELYAACLAHRENSGSVPGRACLSYLRGFLEGAALLEADEPAADGASFRERALRSRAGGRYAALTRYCFDRTVSLEDLVSELLTRGADDPDGAAASTLVQRTLSRFNDCRAR